MSKHEIAKAAKTLDDLLMYSGEGDCPVSQTEAQAMWDAAADMHGFAAVRGFLSVCMGIGLKHAIAERNAQSNSALEYWNSGHRFANAEIARLRAEVERLRAGLLKSDAMSAQGKPHNPPWADPPWAGPPSWLRTCYNGGNTQDLRRKINSTENTGKSETPVSDLFAKDPPSWAQDKFNGGHGEQCCDCGAWCEVVRPGKTQCRNPDCEVDE
jgi:hypothetical protein